MKPSLASYICAITASPFISLYRCFAFSTLWGWFLVPVLSVPVLPLWTVYGIFLLFVLARPSIMGPTPKIEREEWSHQAIGQVITTSLVLVVALVVHLSFH